MQSQRTRALLPHRLQRTVDGTRAMIDLFWEAPAEYNRDAADSAHVSRRRRRRPATRSTALALQQEQLLGYVIKCNVTDGDGTTRPIAAANVSLRHSRAFHFSSTSGRVACTATAKNEQSVVGAASEPVTIDSSGERTRGVAPQVAQRARLSRRTRVVCRISAARAPLRHRRQRRA